uniref:Uncharacterized protein n=1 Tax=Anguilla anguilla TaxID=7936 RepID=A0A0E9RWM6_ANGAN
MRMMRKKTRKKSSLQGSVPSEFLRLLVLYWVMMDRHKSPSSPLSFGCPIGPWPTCVTHWSG